jgi:hypothetical protein
MILFQPPNLTKGVAVEAKEGGGAVTRKEEIQRFPERQCLDSGAFPAFSDLVMSFRVTSKLSFSSFARSSVEAGGKWPVPVFDKSGSAS